MLLLILVITGLALWIDFTPRVSEEDKRALWPTQGLAWRDVHTRLGLDLRGGTQVLLRSRDSNIDAESLEVARGVIESRVNGLGVSEATVQTSGSDRIIVELPDVDQPETALQTIRSTGKLELIDPQGQYLPQGQLVRTTGSPTPSIASTNSLTSTDTVSATQDVTATQELAQAMSGPLFEVVADGNELKTTSVQPGVDQTGKPVVSFEFEGDSATRLQTFTAQNIGKPLTIVLDNRVQSSATIQDVLPGSGQISSNTTQDRDAIYNVLRYGSLPVGFDVETSRTVTATLGEASINASFIAGIVGLLAVALFMIIYYRLPGLLSVIALLIYTAISFALYRFIPITLTLAGIAGFILSIGLAVDGNVLIFARLKEELRRGRSLNAAVEEGFIHAWPSIRDSNISTFITTMILYWFGSSFGVSIIKGFALTLGLGIAVSLFTAVVITRTFLRLLVESGAFRRRWWYAVEEPSQQSAARAAEAL
ncbi:MAG TPA: protein translocase subunit SecD [Herpetosiphonaceae bacterium]